MNFGNEPPASGPQRPLGSQTGNAKPLALRPEEVAMYKECSRGLYYKVGLPFAVLYEIVASNFFKDQGEKAMPKILLKRGFRFLGNVVIGRFLFTPICYNKLVAMRAEYVKNNKDLENQGITNVERIQPMAQTKDFNYPSNQVTNINELEGSFSSDFNTSKLISDDLDNINSPKTTYQELRAKHRSGYGGYRGSPSNLESEPLEPGTYSAPVEKPIFDDSPPPPPPLAPPQKIVRKTKYGDEME